MLHSRHRPLWTPLKPVKTPRTPTSLKRALVPLALLLAATLGAIPAEAQLAVAAKAGTLGLGAEVTARLHPRLNLRLGLNRYTYSDQRRESGIDYDAEARLRSATLLADWFPLFGGFHLTGGLVRNDTEARGSSLAPPSGIYNIGGVPVPAALVGTLRARVDFDHQVPYAGLGWGNPVSADHKLAFYLDLGVVFQGRPRVQLVADLPPGSPLNDPAARQALEILLQREAREIEDDLKDYDKYPVVALGLAYRF